MSARSASSDHSCQIDSIDGTDSTENGVLAVCVGISELSDPRVIVRHATTVHSFPVTDDGEQANSVRLAVVVPCFNDGETIEEAIDSVLDSSQAECELIVVDDGSTDSETMRVFDRLEQKGVRVFHQPNKGPSAARMAGVHETTAPYLFFLDADDVLAPGALSTLVGVLDAEPEAVAAWGDARTFGETTVRFRKNESLDPWLLSYVNVLPSAAAFRRTELLEVGGYAAKIVPGHEDWDLWMALAERGYRGIHVPEVVGYYRVHGARRWRSVTQKRDAIFAELKQRHPLLFEKRRENKKRSTAPRRLKLALPLIERLTFLPTRARVSLANLLVNPVSVARVALSLRLRRAARKIRKKTTT